MTEININKGILFVNYQEQLPVRKDNYLVVDNYFRVPCDVGAKLPQQ